MPLDLDEYSKLRREVDATRRRADEAAGALKQTMTQLRERGLKSVADAEKRRAKLDGEIAELEGKFDAGLVAYREKFSK